MTGYGDIVEDSVESLVTDVVIKAKLDPVTVRIAKVYRIYSVAKTAIKIGGHISYGNYYSAAGEAVKFVLINKASDAASSWIVERGGFVATVTVADSGLVIEADIVAEVLNPLESDWLTILLRRHGDIEGISGHQRLILQRAERAEEQAAFAKEQALRAARIAGDQVYSSAARRALSSFFPWLEDSMIRGDHHRFGQRRFPEATIYQGTLAGAKREGYGVLRDASGNRYAGMWREDAPFGYGVRVYPNGIEYRGEYVRPQDHRAYGRDAGVSADPVSGGRYAGEHERQHMDGFNMIPDGYGQGLVNGRTLKGKWESGIFLQHLESAEDLQHLAATGRGKAWMHETVQTPFASVRGYFKSGSITLDGSFY